MCAGAANTLWDYLQRDNYANTKYLVGHAMDGIALNVIANVPNFFINALLTRWTASSSTSDACGQKDDATYAADAASSIYQFCLAIQNEKMEDTATRYDAMDSEDSSTRPAGMQGLAKYFISQQAETWAPVCRDYGIVWRRRLLQSFRSLTGSWSARE